jgi:hypothetical protein
MLHTCTWCQYEVDVVAGLELWGDVCGAACLGCFATSNPPIVPAVSYRTSPWLDHLDHEHFPRCMKRNIPLTIAFFLCASGCHSLSGFRQVPLRVHRLTLFTKLRTEGDLLSLIGCVGTE